MPSFLTRFLKAQIEPIKKVKVLMLPPPPLLSWFRCSFHKHKNKPFCQFAQDATLLIALLTTLIKPSEAISPYASISTQMFGLHVTQSYVSKHGKWRLVFNGQFCYIATCIMNCLADSKESEDCALTWRHLPNV